MLIEVVYASKTKQRLCQVNIPQGGTVRHAIEASFILDEFPEIQLNEASVGIFSKKATLASLLIDGDRVEIYRPLTLQPMQKRKLLASKQKK